MPCPACMPARRSPRFSRRLVARNATFFLPLASPWRWRAWRRLAGGFGKSLALPCKWQRCSLSWQAQWGPRPWRRQRLRHYPHRHPRQPRHQGPRLNQSLLQSLKKHPNRSLLLLRRYAKLCRRLCPPLPPLLPCQRQSQHPQSAPWLPTHRLHPNPTPLPRPRLARRCLL